MGVMYLWEDTITPTPPPPQPSTADWGEDAELEGTEDPGRQIFSSLGRGDNQGIGKDRGGGTTE